MRQYAILILSVVGLSIWFFSNIEDSRPKAKRSIASQFEIDEDEVEYDFHESVNVRKNKDAKPTIKSKSIKKQKEQKSKIENAPSKIIDVIDESDFSMLDIDRLIKLCEFGDRDACHRGGSKLFAADPKSLPAVKLLARGCSLKLFSDCHQVGEILKSSHGSRTALPYFKAACEQAGLADSCFEAAIISSEKSQTEIELEKTKEYFNIACLEGNAKGCMSLAKFYANNWPKHQYYLNEACKIDASLDASSCQQIIN